MALDPAVRELLDRETARSAAAGAGPPPDAAAMRAAFAAARPRPSRVAPVASVADHYAPGPDGPVRVRLYLPHPPEAADPVPVFAWFHGGGWTLGSIEENDLASRAVCAGASVAVAAVDYRLAPEHPYPAAPRDCLAVVRWLAAGGAGPAVAAGRVAVGGESAGGNLSTVVAMTARDGGGPPIAAQVLICPVFGHPDDGTASYADFADGYGMTAGVMRFFFEQYLTDPAQRDDPYALPSRAAGLAGLPPALVLTAEYDVLRDEGEAFAARLERSGVPVERHRYEGQIHGFYGLYTDLPASPRAHARVAAYLRGVFA